MLRSLMTLKVEVWAFLVAIIVANFIFVTSIGEEWIPEHLYSRGRLFLLAAMLVSVVFIARGPKAILELVKPLFVWRVSPLWFVVAVLWPIVFATTFLIGHATITGQPLQLINESGLALVQRPGFLLYIFWIALIGEIVWVGYSIGMLSRFYSLVLACFITGAFWTLWWLPMMIYDIGIIPGLTFVTLLIAQTGVSLFCGFFYMASRSGLVILSMQYCFNLSLIVFAVLPNQIGEFAFGVFGVSYVILGVIAVTVVLPKFKAASANNQ